MIKKRNTCQEMKLNRKSLPINLYNTKYFLILSPLNYDDICAFLTYIVITFMLQLLSP